MWLRACPHCGAALLKPALDFMLECSCGWTWLGDPRREVEELAPTGELLYIGPLQGQLPQAA